MPKLIMPPPMDTPSPPMAARAAPAAASSAEAPAPMSFVAGVLPLCYVTPGAAGACSRGAGSGTALRSVGTLRNSSGVAGGAGRRIWSGLAARFCCGAEASFSPLARGPSGGDPARAVGKPGGWAAHTKSSQYIDLAPCAGDR